MSRADAAARQITDQLDPTDLPVDPEEIAHGLGALVIRQPADSRVSGILLRRDEQPVIGLNAERSEVAQRFTLAHLVGHLQLHARRELILDTVERHRYPKLSGMPTDREEAEASRFALALLAPEPVVRKAAVQAEFKAADELVDLLASRFELSRTAMACRLMGLGIIMDI